MNRNFKILAIALAAFAGLTGCGKKSPPITDCNAVDSLRPICRFHNPEDLELLPDGKTLIVSQMGNFIEKKPGDLALFDTASAQLTVIFPNPAIVRSEELWGDASCPGLPGAEFTPHGISLKQRGDGRWQLAAINHGQRETVEMFEVVDTAGHYELVWHGCAVPPAGIFMNDLALLRDGGFIASNMFDPRKPEIGGMNTEMFKSMFGIATGYVFEWTPNKGIRALEGSHAAMPNGVAISADEDIVFASATGGKAVLKLDRTSGKLLGSVPIPQPDNLSWDNHGQLLSVGYTGGVADQMECAKHPGSNCSGSFEVIRIDPNTLQANIALQHSSPPLGTASIARQVGDHLYIGSFTGDRLVEAPYAAGAAK